MNTTQKFLLTAFVLFVAAHFNELVSSSTLTPTSCHSARRVYPELQNHISKSEGKPLFFELNSFYKLSPNPQ